jgi:hypothetical protein
VKTMAYSKKYLFKSKPEFIEEEDFELFKKKEDLEIFS